jgi:4a-hydroxytetrahydrobiopterin dehydratase
VTRSDRTEGRQVQVLNEAEIRKGIQGSAWELADGEITRSVVLGSFADSISYVNMVARIAEEADHHPDIDIRFNRVVMRLSTHSAGGVTARDLELARRIDELG